MTADVQHLTVLAVDDSHDDLELVAAALNRVSGYRFTLHTAHDGEAAADYLTRALTSSKLPVFALVDLKMPRMDGRALSEHIKATPKLRPMPVLILSTSTRSSDVLSCYESGCNAYYQKPLELKELVELLQSITDHWCGCARLGTR